MHLNTQTLYEEINKFDDAEFIKCYGGNSKHLFQSLKILDEDEAKDLILCYWRLMHELLNEPSEENEAKNPITKCTTEEF